MHLSITKIPPRSGPRVFSTGTLALSNVIYAVPAAVEMLVLICDVSTPSPRSTRITKRRVALQEHFEGLYLRSSKPCDLEDHSITLPKNLVVNTRRSVKENEHIFCLVSTVRGPVDFSHSLTLIILTLVYTFPCLQHQTRDMTLREEASGERALR